MVLYLVFNLVSTVCVISGAVQPFCAPFFMNVRSLQGPTINTSMYLTKEVSIIWYVKNELLDMLYYQQFSCTHYQVKFYNNNDNQLFLK